ncbi:uncharacterized protein LOC142568530 [Dermacentor variabilis]|uniref:uncharacterized protein LOC142568530 n=1 Tax=Dermacentor variabilis TaxID=34621 RepID=UPI003F5C33E0
MRPAKLCYFLLDDYSPGSSRTRYTPRVNTLNTTEIVSVRSSGVGEHVLLGRQKIHIDWLCATEDSYNVMADLEFRSTVIEKQPRVSRRNPETACHGQGVPTESRRFSCEPRDPKSSSAPGILSSTASTPSGSPATPWMTPKDLTRSRSSNERVCKMVSRRGRLRESAAYLVGSCSVVCLSVNQLSSNVRCVRSISGHHQEDLDKSCTASAADRCLHFAELSLWNNFLWVIIIKLREGRLGLACLRGRVVPLTFMRRRRSFILVHCPLMQHRSTVFLQLLESRMSPKQFQLRDGVELSKHLRYARPCCRMLDYPTRDPMDALPSTLTSLDPLENLSVRFSSVGVSKPCEVVDSCDIMRTLVVFERWTDVSDAQALMR